MILFNNTIVIAGELHGTARRLRLRLSAAEIGVARAPDAPLPLVDPGGQVDLYYLGIDTVNATYQQGSGREVRHSIGTRLFNRPPGAPSTPGFDYNLEFVYQFGTFRSNGISAWTAATETGFTFSIPWTPRIALRADIASGGRHPNGGALNTFNPLFPRGAYFGPKLTMFGPFNFFDVHPIL